MLHHISLPVNDLIAARNFYDSVLAALGYRCVFTHATAIGYGINQGQDKFCLKLNPDARAASAGFHLAFAAPSRRAVDEFYLAAMAKGGQDNGAPGLRSHYGPSYYAAFVIDVDGHRLEAVCNKNDAERSETSPSKTSFLRNH